MEHAVMEWVFRKIAEDNHASLEEVRQKMQAAMDEAQLVADFTEESLWNAIPRSGEKLTLSEFIEFIADYLNRR